MKLAITTAYLLLTTTTIVVSQDTSTQSSLRGGGRNRILMIEEKPYKYSIDNDCYKERNDCPPGTFCQVEERDNWYPYDVSYINRGRCLPYAKVGGSCHMPFDGVTSFPRKADGSFFDRSTLCEPTTTTCTGDYVFVLPPTCVEKRDPFKGCMSTRRNGCAGRSSLAECPDDTFCFFPPHHASDAQEEEETVTTTTTTTRSSTEFSTAEQQHVGRMTKAKLEQCGAIVASFNGPDFAFTMARGGGNPDDSHIEAGETKQITKKSLEHGMFRDIQETLQTLWPYDTCRRGREGDSDSESSNCTSFPLPVPARDSDGGLVAGKCLQFNKSGKKTVDEVVDCDSLDSSVDMSFLREQSSNGATDYHCTWAILHTLSFNGGALLTTAEKRAFGELILYISGQFDCKVCRNNFVNIIKRFGLPKGNIREDYARWLWQAHNNANEHSYATHSMDLTQAVHQLNKQETGNANAGGVLRNPFSETRTDEWSNPAYEHPWYMTFEDAERVWTNILDH